MAGDSEIDGRHLFAYVDSCRDNLVSKAGVEQFLEQLSIRWEHDVATFRWDSESDKADYIDKAKISLLFATAFNSLYVIDGKFRGLTLSSFQPPQKLLAFGMPDLVMDDLKKEPRCRRDWMHFLANIFRTASRRSKYVAPPVDIVLWTEKDEMSWRRFDDCDILAESTL